MKKRGLTFTQAGLIIITVLLFPVLKVFAFGTAQKGDSFLLKQTEIFETPDMSVWPEVRWWMAQGAHTDQTLIESVKTLYEQGYGGMELLTLNEGTIPNDLYGWGTEEWYHDNYIVVKTATELGMGVSFAAGPDWQPSFPYYEDDPDYKEPEKWGKEYPTSPNSDVYSQGLAAAEAVYVKGGESVLIDLTTFTYNPPANTGGMRGGPGGGPSRGGPGGDMRGGPEGGMPSQGMRGGPVGQAAPDSDQTQELTLDTLGTIIWGYDYDLTFKNFQTIAIAKVEEEGSTVLSIDQVDQLSEDEVFDHISYDDNTGTYTFNWTAPDDGDIYVLIPFWRVGAGHGTAADTDAFGTMFVVNHFTDEAATAQFNYWRTYLFDDEMVKFFQKNGRIGWFMDSMELGKLNNSVEWWAYDFIDEFYETAGYDLTPYLPILFGRYTLDENSNSIRQLVWQDYYQMLTDTYIEYLTTMKNLLNSISVELRAQVAYGQNFNMSQSVRGVDVPEVETLAFNDNINPYKTMSGAAHLLGRNDLSSETGALRGSYVYTSQEYIKQVHQQLAGGVNRAVWHGFTSLAGPDRATLWPGFESSMGFDQSERWANRSPLKAMEKDYTNHQAILQTVLRAGDEKLDVAILTSGLQSIGPMRRQSMLRDSLLQEAGYSYEFFDETYLEDSEYCYLNKDNTLGNPEYKAVVVLANQMKLSSAQALYNLAESGLKVILLDGAAVTTNKYSESDEELAEIISSLKELQNVKTISANSGIVGALDELDVKPRVAYAEEVMLWNLMTVSDDATYIYVFNETDGDIHTVFEVEGTYTPYVMDTWSGKISPIGEYRYKDGRTVFEVSIKSDNTHVYIFNEDVIKSVVYAVSSSADEVRLIDGQLVIIATADGDYTTILSDGTSTTNSVTVPEIEQPESWYVTIESWTQGEKVSVTEDRGLGHEITEVYYETKKTNVIENEWYTDLKYWIDMEGAGNAVSGLGYYTTSINLPNDWDFDASGLYLDLGEFEGSARVTVNDVAMNAINIDDPVVDISSALKIGENEVTIQVTSTLSNVLLNGGVNRFTSTWWYPSNLPKELEQNYGLTEVTFIPYTMTPVNGK